MFNKFVSWFIIRTCFTKVSVMKLMDKIFVAWLNNTPDLTKKEKIVAFVNMTLGLVQDRMPMYNVAISEARSEVVSIMNNNNSSEPRIMCPRCKTLLKIPRIGEKKTLSWSLNTTYRTKEVIFNCTKCGYTKPLGMTTSY